MGIFRPARSRVLLIVGLAASATVPLPVPAQPPIDLSLLGTVHPGFRMDGIDAGDRSGSSVSGAGDVNGDGLADVIVSGYLASPGGDSHAGESYVVFGKADGTAVELSLIGTTHAGFRIDGIDANDVSGGSVSGAGDVNGDGLADLIVGAWQGDPEGFDKAGESYVVFGKADGGVVDLSLIGTTHPGFRIEGIRSYDHSGWSVSGAGDVNGDGLADLIVGARGARSETGDSYVVFGKEDGAVVRLHRLGSTHPGFRIAGIGREDLSGWSVSGAGDVNGDGMADLIVGARNANSEDGEAYVVFGKTDRKTVDLSLLGTTHSGFRIKGSGADRYLGRSVSGAGDVNGDGLADIAVGVPIAGGRIGAVHIVFGKRDGAPADVSLPAAMHPGFRIDGGSEGRVIGTNVSSAGDVNGDGLADIIVGAYTASPGGDNEAGESYVVFGKADGTPVDVTQLGTTHAGFRIEGIDADDRSGWSVSGAGDVNGDGMADLLVGALKADSDTGESYVVFSPMIAPATSTYKSARGAGTAHLSPIGVSGGGNNDDTPDSRAWIGFADGDAASMQTVTIHRDRSLGQTFSPTVWEVSTDRTGWTSATVKFKYTDAEVEGLAEADLLLSRSNGIGGPFVPVATTVDTAKNTVSAEVSSFSFFAIRDNRIFEGLVVE